MKIWLCVNIDEELVEDIVEALIEEGVSEDHIAVIDHLELDEPSTEENKSVEESKTM